MEKAALFPTIRTECYKQLVLTAHMGRHLPPKRNESEDSHSNSLPLSLSFYHKQVSVACGELEE